MKKVILSVSKSTHEKLTKNPYSDVSNAFLSAEKLAEKVKFVPVVIRPPQCSSIVDIGMYL